MNKHFKFMIFVFLCAKLLVSSAFAEVTFAERQILNGAKINSILSFQSPERSPSSPKDLESTPSRVSSQSKLLSSHNRRWGFQHKDGIVLVLSGGGTKGLAHIGVFEELEKADIPIAAIVGTSMGGIMGGLYASGYNAAELKEHLNQVNIMEIISDRSISGAEDIGYNSAPTSKTNLVLIQKDDRRSRGFMGKQGLLQAKNLYTYLSEMTARVSVADFDDLPIPFAAIATNLQNGDTVVLREGNLASALRATMSIPGIFEPWEIDGTLLVDGGLKANLPVIEAKKMFPDHPIVAVNLSPEDISKDRGSIRSLLDVAAQSLEILMVEQIRRNVAAADLVISPKVSDFGVLDSGGYDKIIERGVEATKPQIEAIKRLLSECEDTDSCIPHLDQEPGRNLKVSALRFEGVPKNIANALYAKYGSWVGEKLDMKKLAEAIKELSRREDFSLVEARTKRVSRSDVEIVIFIERPAKYEVGINGYVGNISRDGWFSIETQIRDILMDGDVGSLEYRLGNRWGLLGRYFTPPTFQDTQFGLVLSAREEGFETRDLGTHEFERYSARLAWYKNFGRRNRFGIGYAVSRISQGDTFSGPYLSLNINTLDDPVLPTKGWSLTSDVWAPFNEVAMTHSLFQYHLPTCQEWKMVFQGGLKTGNADNIAYAAILGNREELYSLSKHPLVGDQAYWLHIGASRNMMRSWWGGVNVELFGRYGQVLKEWKNHDSWWETGIALTMPTNNFAGKVIVVYDQDGEFTFGYSFGIPRWWSGPIP